MSVADAEQPLTSENAKKTKIIEIERNGTIEQKDEEAPDQASNATTTYNHVSPAKQSTANGNNDTGAEKEKDLEAQIKKMEKENEQLRNAQKAYDNSENIKELEAKLANKNMAMMALEKKSTLYSDLLNQIDSGDYISKQILNEQYITKDEMQTLLQEHTIQQSNITDDGSSDDNNNRNEQILNEFNSFKQLVVDKLQSIRKDSVQLESDQKGLQIRFNDERHQRSKNNKSQEAKMKKANSEIKTLRNKYNEVKNENGKNSQNTQKMEKQFDIEKSQIQSKIDKLTKDKQLLNKQLDTQKALVERVRKEKKEVSENNQSYLRSEKQKISKELDKEKVIKLELQTEVTRLQDTIESLNVSMKEYKSRTHSSDSELQKQSTTAKNALREKKAAIKKLQEKSKIFKTQEQTIGSKNSEINDLKSKCDNFRKDNVVLHEALRKKSDKEKNFEVREKKLNQKEKSLKEKEKWLNGKIAGLKKPKKSPKPKKDSDRTRSDNDPKNTDPLFAIRNLLPWHWISIILFLVLMLAIASRNL